MSNNGRHRDTLLNILEPVVDQVAGVPCLRLKLSDAAGRTRITPELMDHLADSLKSEREVRLMTIEGAPGSFCEGLDIESLAVQCEDAAVSPSDESMARCADEVVASLDVLAHFAELLAWIERLPWPVVALVDGPALGGGVGLAAVADLVLASSRASFALPEALMGLIPAMVFPFIARRIGVPKTRLLALGDSPLSATKAFQLGLVDEITDDLESALASHARRFSRMDSRAIGAMKTLLSSHFTMPPAGYQASASSRFLELLSSRETLTRLIRFTAGEAPWSEDNVL